MSFPSDSDLVSPSFTEIPTIDLSLLNDSVTRPHLLAELRHVLTNVGFLYISNHGVLTEVIGALVDLLPTLFSLSAETKAEVALENSPHFLGYSAVGSETTAGKADSREQFEFATELTPVWRPGLPLYERLVGPNQVRHSFCTALVPTWQFSCNQTRTFHT
jgi:isopenicillin N synthase-like dioxygenase